MKNRIYVVLTSTSSKFGRVIRLLTGDEYNHLSISLHKDLSDMCTFARRKYTTPLNAGFMYEKLEYYTLNKYTDIGVRIYEIPVTKRQYNKVARLINNISNDDEYMYNLFSAITFPFLGGFHMYKTFTCVEFVAYLLYESDIIRDKKPCKYTPNEFGNLLNEYLYYDGNLLDILNNSNDASDFFKKESIEKLITMNTIVLYKLSRRLGSKILSIYS